MTAKASVAAVAGAAAGAGLGFLLGQRLRRREGHADGYPMFSIDAGTAVYVVDSLDQLQAHATRLLGTLGSASAPVVVVGLDTEWAAGKTVAVWQLAFPDTCLLIRVHKLRNSPDGEMQAPVWPQSFVDLVHHTSLVYSGCAIRQDLTLIRQQLGIDLTSCVELQSVARHHGFDSENGVGLQGLARTLLRQDLSKDMSVRCGNWKADPLSKPQVDYAAADAVVGRKVLLSMFERSVAGEPPASDFVTWLQPFLCDSAKPADAKAKPASVAVGPTAQKPPSARALKASRKVTMAEVLAKSARVAAASAGARQPYIQFDGITDGQTHLTDVRVISGFVVSSSSFAKGLPPQNCLPSVEVLERMQEGAERDWLLGEEDWRAERKAAVKFEGPAIACFEVGAACHWIEIEQPSPVQVSCFALRCTASAACHTNGPAQWLLQGHAGGEADTWEALHICAQLEEEIGDVASSPPQAWEYDNASFSNNEIPGETRFFHTACESYFRRFRLTFFSASKAFSVNLSGLLLFGRRAA